MVERGSGLCFKKRRRRVFGLRGFVSEDVRQWTSSVVDICRGQTYRNSVLSRGTVSLYVPIVRVED